MPSKEQNLQDQLKNLDLELAPECLAMLTSRNTTTAERRQCHLSRAYTIRDRAMKVEKDYQENNAKRDQLQSDLMDGLMRDHQSVSKLVVGLRSKLQAEGGSVFGEHTGRFEDVSDLVLYLLFEAPRAQKPWLKWWQFWK